tara:strand:- start:3161 stop:3661 length:501 start_codon:yes stop_codon:yes gene_type:complete
MKKILNLTLSGVLLIAAGVLMLVAEKIGLQISKMIIPLLFALSGVLCLLFYSANKKYKIPSQFQFLQGLGLITYAIVIFLFPKSLLQFLMVTSCFIMLFGITEIGFSFSVLNSSSKTFKEPLVFRIIGGFVIAFAALLARFCINFRHFFPASESAPLVTTIVGKKR